MIIYIDDIFIAKFNRFIINELKRVFNIKFRIINLKLYIYYLNIKITRDYQNRIITLIGNIESKLKNLSLSNALFVFEVALSFFRNIDFRVLSRIIY